MKKPYISNNVIRRLPRYLRRLDELSRDNVERISSSELGRQMGLTPSQIRQDFSCFGEFGQQGYGYNVKALRSEIAGILGLDRSYSAVLVGVGNLGHALVGNFQFSRFGFRLIGAFEVNPEIIGTRVGPLTVMSADVQADFIRDNDVDIAVLSVPRDKAQEVADRIIKCGVKAIWNFTDVEIDVGSSGVVVESLHFSDSLMALSYFLSEKLDGDEK